MESMFTFIELSAFSKYRKHLLADDEFRAMQQALIINPELGSVIPDTGGFRKLRWSVQGKGKSGGVRTIYYNRAEQSGRLYLALIYRKSDQENLTAEQKKQLKQIVQVLS